MGVEGEDGAGGGRGAKGGERWTGDRRYRGRKRGREEEEGGGRRGYLCECVVVGVDVVRPGTGKLTRAHTMAQRGQLSAPTERPAGTVRVQ